MGGNSSQPSADSWQVASRDAVTDGYNSQVAAYGLLYNNLIQFYTFLNRYLNYMLTSDYINFINESRALVNNLPTVLTDVQKHYLWWGFDYYTYNVNGNFNSQMGARRDALSGLYSKVRTLVLNNCNNPNTAISQDKCGMGVVKSNFQGDTLQAKLLSNNTVNKLTPANPQYQTAKNLDDWINSTYDWNYMNDTFNESGVQYSTYNKDTINTVYSSATQKIQQSYNYCADPTNTTLISLNDDGKPNCLAAEYDKANTTCSKGISQSKVYEYDKGTELLTKLWTDVSNSIPGNTIQANRTVLITAQDSCNKWVQMFNVWEEKEAEALATPCNPERTIQTTYDPAMLQMAEDWNRSASSHIESLMKRLEVINRYIETYPHILQLRADDVTFGPNSLGASMLLKYKVNELKPGVAPVQYLEMLVPNGAQGKTGDVGPVGLPGEPGHSGSLGKVGKMGDPTLPAVYE